MFKYFCSIILLILSLSSPATCQSSMANALGLDELNTAIYEDKPDEVRRLLKANPELLRVPDRNLGTYPIHSATMFNKFSILKILIEEFGDNPRTLSNKGRLTTHYAAFTGNVTMMDYLINIHYVSIDYEAHNDGFLPIHCAIIGTQSDMVKFLLKNGSKTTSTKKEVASAITMAKALRNYKQSTEMQSLMRTLILQKILIGPTPNVEEMLNELDKIIILLKTHQANIGP